MNSRVFKSLGKLNTLAVFEKGTGALLPEAYKKFFKEWIIQKPASVHYIPEVEKWKRNELTGEVKPVQDNPIPLIFPVEYNNQLWGGEGIVQGFQKRSELKRRVPHFWVPTLRRSVVYSEVLDKYMSVVVTDRAINLINSNYGFDHYLLKTSACDLKSLLALRLKRRILKDLYNECPAYEKGSEKQKRIMQEYGKYLSSFTREEVEWYGYTFPEACKKMEAILAEQNKPVPLKNIYRMELFEKLKAEKISKENDPEGIKVSDSPSSWLQKINPFGRKQET
ncbi:39S ribosomal protein L28, mitochondrial [Coccinella septempunctata]|uniref:39S ribosomal protein L28, mitochondrial n=1 Tax=Coccinella septempunctata TaxID=41139 RepID=UPI001D075C3F|nr:39S ribosomal protein L28, mitochondrial [Coccinella septempunctata]